MTLTSAKPFDGQHCETTATGTLLNQLGIELSEPMLFGLGEGLGFVYWKTKQMPFPFLGGRSKTIELSKRLAANLGLDLQISETTSTTKAWTNVATRLDKGQAVGLQLDAFHLDYFTTKVHFGGHVLAMTGYDDSLAYVVDTAQQGGATATSLESLALARNERGPMTAKNLMYTLANTDQTVAPPDAIVAATRSNAHEFLNPPISNLGYKGIAKTGKQIKKWFATTHDPSDDLATMSMLMERAGTGGALFRNFYRDFLAESYAITGLSGFDAATARYATIAEQWTQVAALFDQAGTSGQQAPIDQACDVLAGLSVAERTAMQHLQSALT